MARRPNSLSGFKLDVLERSREFTTNLTHWGKVGRAKKNDSGKRPLRLSGLCAREIQRRRLMVHSALNSDNFIDDERIPRRRLHDQYVSRRFHATCKLDVLIYYNSASSVTRIFHQVMKCLHERLTYDINFRIETCNLTKIVEK